MQRAHPKMSLAETLPRCRWSAEFAVFAGSGLIKSKVSEGSPTDSTRMMQVVQVSFTIVSKIALEPMMRLCLHSVSEKVLTT